jgi:hypothetical protein
LVVVVVRVVAVLLLQPAAAAAAAAAAAGWPNISARNECSLTHLAERSWVVEGSGALRRQHNILPDVHSAGTGLLWQGPGGILQHMVVNVEIVR